MSGYDFSAVYGGLKDFQKQTVDYVFERMYGEDNPARRFLVADEVGLGKTLVARGLIAKAVDHLDRQGVKRIDVIYICSNADIATQNIRRLSLPGFERATYSSRLTLLPLELKELSGNRLNFVSFTPGTALDLKGNLGRKEERALLYWLLKKKWPDLVGTKKGPMRVFQGGVTSLPRFRGLVKWMDKDLRRIDRTIRDRFFRDIDRHDERARREGRPGIRERFELLASDWAHDRKHRTGQETHERNRFVGDLRNLLAHTCIDALEPDLVILDEFQRFRHILEDGTEAAELAHALFNYADEHGWARVLMLSATPYKMYTLSEETATDDHYQDFVRTAGFLLGDSAKDLQASLHDLRLAMLDLDPDHTGPLEAAKERVESQLRAVMCRTERLGTGEDRNGMLVEVPNGGASLTVADVKSFLGLDTAATQLAAQNPLEYWKSAPYFPNYWDGYQIGKLYEKASLETPATVDGVREILRKSGSLLPWSDWERYRRVDPGNSRLRALASDLLETEAWKLLWLPPSLHYYRLGGPFATAQKANLTKRLVFSSWNVVPRVVSTLLSYEAERRMMRSHPRRNLTNDPEGRKRIVEPLRFPTKATSAMSAFAFVYPSPALARLADPLELTTSLGKTGRSVSRRRMRQLAGERIGKALNRAVADLPIEIEGPADDRWYWAAPLVLDYQPDDEVVWLFTDEDVAWTGEDTRSGGTGFLNHVRAAQQIEVDLDNGQLRMGSFPDDLMDVLALLALGAPGTVAYRSLKRLVDTSDPELDDAVRTASAQIAWGFRSLFNNPEVAQLVRGLKKSGPYWQKALRYCVDGCLQATLDEYLHVLKEFEGHVGGLDADTALHLGERVADVVGLRSADLRARDLLDPVEPVRRMRCRFALPFGQHQSEEDQQVRRADYVRTAFNSPFWPFVLTTTSIGQEGLDFHLYSHAVVHWNLPANPVDLEQREGRVHRYMGHAVRKNLAAKHGSLVFHHPDADPWRVMLDAAIAHRGRDENDLVPYWLYPGDSKIERHVPRLPLSREEARLEDLKRSLALYRMVFGQPRQEDLIEFLKALDLEQAERVFDLLQIDLSPRNGKEAPT